MLYENYRAKMMKVKDALNVIWRFRILIFSVMAVILSALAVFFGVYGMVYDVSHNVEKLTYGQAMVYSADAVFGSVRYEFAVQGTDDWTDVQPVRAGSYKVRAVSRNIFGGNRYGAEYAFTIVPKAIDVNIDGQSVLYGGNPQVVAELEYDDKIECTEFIWEDISSPYTEVVADKDYITIYDASGEDVTENYVLNPVAGLVSFEKREISITVQDKTGIYDGNVLKFDGYQLDEHTPLAEGDSIIAVFEDSITEVGETENIPSIKVIHEEDGQVFDVTVNYIVDISAGKLTIEKRPVNIITPDAVKVYDGMPLSLSDGYSLADDSTLVEGHSLELADKTYITEAGEAQNILTFRVLDEEGTDVSENYSIFLTPGTLTVTPRLLTIVTGSNQWLYDGTAHSEVGYQASDGKYGLIEGHSTAILKPAEIVDVGEVENSLTIGVYDADGDNMTGNYDITYVYGTLAVTPRPVRFVTASSSGIYDGTAYSDGGHMVAEDSEYGLVEGHKSSSSELAEIVDVGAVENRMKIAISDADGADMTGNYEVSYEFGTIRVEPRPITISAASDSKEYDGTLLTCQQFLVTSSLGWALVEGHTARVVTQGSQTDVGTGVNIVVSAKILCDGQDVSGNYEISFGQGVLIVSERTITLTAGSAEKVYDGTPLICDDFTVSKEGGQALVLDHFAKVITGGSQTDVGTGENYVASVAIYDGQMNDVTYRYAIEFGVGTLTVTPRPIIFVTASNEWVYDGKDHFDGDFFVAEDSPYGLVEGHFAEPLAIRTITDVGEIENSMNINIYDGNMFDGDRTDKTFNYDISYRFGMLKVTPRPITITAGSAEKVYDGMPLICRGYEVTSPLGWALVEGHFENVVVIGGQTEVGTGENRVSSVRIYFENREVTSNYQITYEAGTLTVSPRPVTFVTATNGWVYDGKAHSDGDHWVATDSWYGLVDGHKSSSSDLAEIVEFGTIENTMSITISDSYGADKTYNYAIDYRCGTLMVAVGQVIVFTGDSQKVYDGEPCTNAEYSVDTNFLSGYDDVVVEVICTGTITDVGETANDCVVRVYVDGEDYTEYVSIVRRLGTLSVLPRPITVTTGSATWEYDGKAHSLEEYTVTEGEYDGIYYGIVEGQRHFAYNFTVITNPGSKANECYFAIVDANGIYVTGNYDITSITGLLRVNGSGSGSGGGNLNADGSIGGGGAAGAGDQSVVFSVLSSADGQMYMRLKSFGDYDGRSWGEAQEYTQWLDGAYSMNYLTGIALEYSGRSAATAKISSATSDYLLPYYLKTGLDYNYKIQTSDVMNLGMIDGIYSFEYYMYDYLAEGKVNSYLGGYADEEAVYRQFVRSNYLYVPQSTLAYLSTVIAQKGFSADDPDIISKVAAYISSDAVATYNLNYDSTLDEQPDIVVSFMRDYHEGICQHFASAATLMYRALGIPARYTIGYSNFVTADKWTHFTGAMGHAWVEVYIDGMGWVEVEVTGAGAAFGDIEGGDSGGSDGELSSTALTLKPVDAFKSYDGTPLVATAFEGADDDTKLRLIELTRQGYTYSYTFSGSQTVPGTGRSEISSFTLYDPRGNEAVGFELYFMPGQLTVVDEDIPLIMVCPYSLQQIYSGKPLEYGANDYYTLGLPYGWRVEFSLEGMGLTDAGVLDYTDFSASDVIIYDEYGRLLHEGSDYALFFDTQFSLVVERRSITLASASAVKQYDGTPLKDGRIWLSAGSFAEGQTFTALAEKSIVDIGSAINEITNITILDALGNAVTKNYNIFLNCGLLTVIG